MNFARKRLRSLLGDLGGPSRGDIHGTFLGLARVEGFGLRVAGKDNSYKQNFDRRIIWLLRRFEGKSKCPVKRCEWQWCSGQPPPP